MSISKCAQLSFLVPALLAAAQVQAEYAWADVLDATPVYQTVRRVEPLRECYETQVYERRSRSSTPTILGAILGGALGHAVGRGNTNKKVGVAVGAILGGSIGSDVGRHHRHGGHRTRTQCELVEEVREEERLLGYDVRYQYNGQVYATRMDRDPGERIRVRVRVTPVT